MISEPSASCMSTLHSTQDLLTSELKYFKTWEYEIGNGAQLMSVWDLFETGMNI